MNLILLNPEELRADGTVSLRGERATHIRTVLQPPPGAPLRVGIVNDRRATARVESLDASGAVVLRLTAYEPAPPPVPPVDLILALPRPKVMKRLWAPLTALGVGRIVLVNAARVERNYFDTHWITPAGYEPLLRRGLEQARDTRLPEVRVRRRLKPFVEDELDALCADGARLLCDPDGGTRLTDRLAVAPARLVLAMGPEGGWTDFERKLFGSRGFTMVNMGRRPLRTDTACVAALSLAHAIIGARDV